MLTVGKMGRRFGLSRSTLLYYDSIGLLSPSGRSPSNYRLYSDDDVRRMELIDVYRRAGVPLKDVARVLDAGGSGLAEVLEARLLSLAGEIDKLRRQQRLVAGLMKNEAALGIPRRLDKEGWVAILRATGLDDKEMQRWHVEFERLSPEGHQEFLESLGIAADEIERIRRASGVGRS
jgi:DNA-binding transcriptional MerR regulator